MKKEQIRGIGITALTVLMTAAAFLTFPVKHVRLEGKNAWVLVSRVYIHPEDGDWVLLPGGKAAVFTAEGEKQKKVHGRILASSTKGLM